MATSYPYLRLIFDIILVVSVFLFPWVITAVLVLAGLFIFRDFYEFIAIGLIVFALYRVPSERIIASPMWYSIIICGIFASVQILKRSIVIYNHEI